MVAAEVLGMVLLFVLILLSLPVVLPYLAWQERRRRCPVCGRRGTLKVVAQPWMAGEVQFIDWMDMELDREEPAWPVRRRVNPALTRLRCEHCGSEFSWRELQDLGVPV